MTAPSIADALTPAQTAESLSDEVCTLITDTADHVFADSTHMTRASEGRAIARSVIQALQDAGYVIERREG